MAKMKTVSAEEKLSEKFKVEAKAGNHTIYIDWPQSGAGPTRDQPLWDIFLYPVPAA